MTAVIVTTIIGIGIVGWMAWFAVRDGIRYGTEVEGGRGGTHDPMTRKPWVTK